MPIFPDLAIFVVTTTTDDRRQTEPIALPLAHARGVMVFDELGLMARASSRVPGVTASSPRGVP